MKRSAAILEWSAAVLVGAVGVLLGLSWLASTFAAAIAKSIGH